MKQNTFHDWMIANGWEHTDPHYRDTNNSFDIYNLQGGDVNLTAYSRHLPEVRIGEGETPRLYFEFGYSGFREDLNSTLSTLPLSTFIEYMKYKKIIDAAINEFVKNFNMTQS